MEQGYWLGRKRSAQGMAGKAEDSEARLIHFHLAGLYSAKAAEAAACRALRPALLEPGAAAQCGPAIRADPR